MDDFKQPYLGNGTRFLRSVSGRTSPTDGAITHSVIKVTLRPRMCTHWYILYFSDLVWGVLGGPNWATLHENMPLGPNFDGEKKITRPSKTKGACKMYASKRVRTLLAL